MKRNCSMRSAFFIPRVLIGFALSLISVALALFAFGLTPLNNSNSLTDTQGWFHQLASALGVHLDSQKLASLPAPKGGGAGVPLSKIPGEPLQGTSQDQTAANYTGPHNNFRPVEAVHTRPLRQLPKIPPALAVRREVREPARPKPPTDTPTGGFKQTLPGPVLSAPTPTGVSWDGVGVGLAGFVPSSNPPDTNGRVGAKQYVQWNNTSFAVFNKTTGALLYGPAAGNTLFQSLGGVCATHNDGDPVVAFDILAGRWILSQFVVGADPEFSHQCVAVSQTEDATGAYFLYDFVTDPANFVDYPKIGVWPDGYYMSGHVFNSTGTAFLAGRIFVFEREKMLKGLPARQLQADLKRYANKPQFGFLPSDLDNLTPPPAGEAAFVIGPHPTSTNRLASARVAVTWGGAPRIRLTESLIAETWGIPPCVNDTDAGDHRDCVPEPAPATPADYIDNLDFRLMYRLAYRNFGGSPVQESLVGNVTVKGGNSNPNHGAIRWYEFRNAGNSTTTPTVFQASTYDPDAAYRWLGSIAMDKDHNIALGYSKSSLSVKPSIFITGRLSTDAPNTLGTEAQVQAGIGVQQAGGNRWGDYSAMTLDPVDQCTFYYTNEYLKTNGQFNWSTRIASYRFPSCTSAPAWGTLTGTVRSSPSNATLSGVVVTLSNGYAGATNANGVYSFLVPPGTYTATAADADRNCTSASPPSPTVTITSGGTTTQNFSMVGTSNLQENDVAIDDATSGNGNGVINSNECVNLNVALKNNGCANATGISATLTTSTPGVTVTQDSSSYPNLAIDATGTNSTPFQIQTSNSFDCGTEIAFDLTLTFPNGSTTVTFTVPTCTGGADQTIPSSVLDANDPTQADRLGRDGQPSGCGGKACPGGGFPGTKRFQTYNFTNSAAAPACFTVTINAATGGAGDIESAAYLNSYNPANLCQNYLGDSGVVGLGTTVGSASYSFTVPAQSNFVVVVNTTGTITASSQFSGTVSGFFDFTPGPGPCPAH
ncbi:MAG: carboxypeptidase regulatory-like domain-containing protein [Verrucomicrobia bacterium]|nr:MAG: carboxypeptidase regulatory-like domain-containing protein [Verrucomicrobiota bacterium]